jgi:hypothetical protein
MSFTPPPFDLKIVQPGDEPKPGRRQYRWAYRDGKRERIRVIDVNSPTFPADFTDAFRENVRQAIKDNRKVLARG